MYPGEAAIFHQAASPFLLEQGFELVNDPEIRRNKYGGTRATYRSKRGLFLVAGFQPGDGDFARVVVGRQWMLDNRLLGWSGPYAELASRFGLDLPATYELGLSAGAPKTVDRMLVDLKRTLPVILEGVTLEELVALENTRFGVRRRAVNMAGVDFNERVQIIGFNNELGAA